MPRSLRTPQERRSSLFSNHRRAVYTTLMPWPIPEHSREVVTIIRTNMVLVPHFYSRDRRGLIYPILSYPILSYPILLVSFPSCLIFLRACLSSLLNPRALNHSLPKTLLSRAPGPPRATVTSF